MKKLYLAAPLFSKAELDFNAHLKMELAHCFEVFLPQEQKDEGLLVDMIAAGIEVSSAKKQIFYRDLQAIRECDVFLAVLDGRVVDEGVCVELGYAYAIGKKCYGYRTDPRRLLPSGDNPIVECALAKIFTVEQELPGILCNRL